MPKTRLKNLKVTKVDFVEAGANQEAYIPLYKSREKPKTAEKSTIKKVFGEIAKLFGLPNDDVEKVFSEIHKEKATSFRDQMDQMKLRKISSQVWDFCYALQDSLISIISDKEVEDEKVAELMNQSLNDFSKTMADAINKWSSAEVADVTEINIEVTESDVETLKFMKERTEMLLDKAVGAGNEPKPGIKPEGKGEKEMNIDKSKLTPGELAILEEIEKKAGTKEPTPAGGTDPKPAGGSDPAPATDPEPTPNPQPSPGGADLPPEVQKKLEAFEKFQKEAEEKELLEVAKGYEILGKKPEDLVKELKVVKEVSEDAYQSLIKNLDSAKAAMKNSNLFTEFGKSGAHFGGSSDPWTKAEEVAKEIRKSKPDLTHNEAVQMAFDQDAELRKEVEEFDKQ